ncbi:hypothetical protein AAE478_002761 [Parahypoxylon ruwenzoriense]
MSKPDKYKTPEEKGIGVPVTANPDSNYRPYTIPYTGHGASRISSSHEWVAHAHDHPTCSTTIPEDMDGLKQMGLHDHGSYHRTLTKAAERRAQDIKTRDEEQKKKGGEDTSPKRVPFRFTGFDEYEAQMREKLEKDKGKKETRAAPFSFAGFGEREGQPQGKKQGNEAAGEGKAQKPKAALFHFAGFGESESS